jgi:hypothetical protein
MRPNAGEGGGSCGVSALISTGTADSCTQEEYTVSGHFYFETMVTPCIPVKIVPDTPVSYGKRCLSYDPCPELGRLMLVFFVIWSTVSHAAKVDVC